MLRARFFRSVLVLSLGIAAGCGGAKPGAGEDPGDSGTGDSEPALCEPTLDASVLTSDPEELAAALSGYRAVAGDIRVSWLDDLSALSGICRIGGALEIANSSVTDLRGLEALEVVGGVIRLVDTPLRSLDGLDGLIAAGGLIVEGTQLEALVVPPGLTALDTLSMSDNASLTRLEGGVYVVGLLSTYGYLEEIELPLLRSVGEALLIEPSLRRLDLSALEEAEHLAIQAERAEISLPALAQVYGELSLSLKADQALPSLQQAGTLSVGRSEGLSLPELGAVGELFVTGTGLPRAPRLSEAGRLTLTEVSDADLSALSGLEVAEGVVIEGGSLRDLSGLAALSSLDILSVYDVRLLATVALPPVASLSYLGFYYVPSLSSLDAPILEIGDLALSGTALSDLGGLSQLQAVTGNLLIIENPELPQAEIDILLSRITVGGVTHVE